MIIAVEWVSCSRSSSASVLSAFVVPRQQAINLADFAVQLAGATKGIDDGYGFTSSVGAG